MAHGKSALEKITAKVWKGSQSVNYEQIANMGPFKVKICVKRDSYDKQSYAVGYVFSPAKLEWSTVYSIPYPKMASLKTAHAHADGEPTEPMFNADVVEITKNLRAILF